MRLILLLILALSLLLGGAPVLAESPLPSGGDSAVDGNEKEPAPCTFGDFFSRLSTSLSGRGMALTLSQPVYSGGAFVRVLLADDLRLLVKTAGAEDADALLGVLVTGKRKDAAAVLALSALCMDAACGLSGALGRELPDTEAGALTCFGDPLWGCRVKGYALSLSQTGDRVSGAVESLAQPPVKKGYAPLQSPDSIPMFANAVPLDLLAIRLNAFLHCFSLPGVDFVGQESGKPSYDHVAPWDSGIITASSAVEDGPVSILTINTNPERADSAFPYVLSAFMAAADVPFELAAAFAALKGEDDAWADLCAIKPYAVYHGVALQFFKRESDFFAVVYGVE